MRRKHVTVTMTLEEAHEVLWAINVARCSGQTASPDELIGVFETIRECVDEAEGRS